MFLRTYSADISLISPQGDHELSADQRMRLEEAGVALLNGPCEPIRIEGGRVLVPTPTGCRSADRRVGRESVSTCSAWWSPAREKLKILAGDTVCHSFNVTY